MIQTYYIYEITNNINGKNYIGQRCCPLNKTPWTDTKYMGSGKYIKNAEMKYGIENFSKNILAICYDTKILDILETEYISAYKEIGKAEYNIAGGGQSRCREYMSEENILELNQKISKGIRNSEKWHNAMKSEKRSKKISESLKGKPSWNKDMKMSDEFCENLSTSINAMYNSPKGEIVKDKIRKARANQVITEETRKKISESQKQIIHTPEWNRKVSEAQKGKTVSEETKQKIREKRKLQAPMSEESKQKFKKSIAEYWNSPEGQLQKKINSERNKGKKNTKGLHWYNNGAENVVAEKCPDGYVPGRLGNFACSEEEKQKKREYERNLTLEQREARSKKISEAHKGHTTSQETRQNISKANKGRKYFNNGIIEVMRFEQPEGFVPGRLPSVFHKN